MLKRSVNPELSGRNEKTHNLGKVFALTALGVLILAIALPQMADAQGAGKALDFDGSDDYVDCGNDASLNITSAITLEAWVKFADLTQSKKSIISKSQYGAYAFAMDWLVPDAVSFDVWVDGDYRKPSFPISNFSAGVWYHLAGTFNGSYVRLYVNGALKDSVQASGTIGTSDVPFIIGAESDPGGTAAYFNGTIDEVRIWNVARTEAQIRNWMHKTENLTSESGLVSVWHFDESTVGPNSAVDSKGNNHGTPTNMTNDDCVTSTAPLGEKGAFVITQTQTNVGPTGG